MIPPEKVFRTPPTHPPSPHVPLGVFIFITIGDPIVLSISYVRASNTIAAADDKGQVVSCRICNETWPARPECHIVDSGLWYGH